VEGLRVKEKLLIEEKTDHQGRDFDAIEKDLQNVRDTIKSLQSMRSRGDTMDFSPVRDGAGAMAAWKGRPVLSGLTAARR
jgi:hypothetical protein